MAQDESGGTTTGSGTVPEEQVISDDDERRLDEIRPYIVPGFVFALDDEDTGRTDSGKRRRPTVLVRVPPLHKRPALALHQRVAVSARISWKHESFGAPPASASERSELLRERGWASAQHGAYRRSTKMVFSKHVVCTPSPFLLWSAGARWAG
jgi:hypothetical protein